MEKDYDPDSLRGIGARRRELFDSLRRKAQSKKKGGPAFSNEDNSSDNNNYNLRSSTKKRKCASTKSAVSATVHVTTKNYNDVERARDDKKNTNQNNKDPDDSDLNHGNVLEFDSDDSVKDKDYNPDEISLSSNSSYQSTQQGKIEAVKRMLFTPEKFQNKVLNEANESQDLITLVDLLGSQALVPYRKSPFRMLLKKLDVRKSTNVIEPMAIDSSGVIRFDGQQNLELNSHNNEHPGSPEIPGPSNNGRSSPDKSSDIIRSHALVPYRKFPFRMLLNKLDVRKPTNVIEPMAIDSSGVIRFDGQQNLELNSHNNEHPGSPEIPGPSNNGRSRKRQRNDESWVRVRSKNARLRGSPYTSSVAKKQAARDGRRLKPPCSCRAKCTTKVSELVRLIIFNNFWKESQSWDQRRQYVVSCTQKKIKATMKTGADMETDRRKFSYNYNLILNEKTTKVCKTMFLNTLCVSEKFITNSLDKTLESGIVAPDQRGKHTPGNKTPTEVTASVCEHISSYPCYESHYTRNKTQRKYLGPELNLSIMYRQYVERMNEKEVEPKMIAKEWLYRHVFNTQFNLSFKLPGVDTCDECDAFQRKLKDATTDDKKKEISEEKKAHDAIAQQRYDLKAADKECSRNSGGKMTTVMFDLQKCMPTPCLTNSKSFYLRKLWTLNLTIYDSTINKASNMVWSENISGRGGNEIASCLIRWAQENLQPEVEEITFWSDNCAGQNRNSMVIMAFIWILNQFPNLKKINHKYLLKGHTHMEVDHIHSIIERKKKQIPTMEIAVPRDWSQFIRTCGAKRSLHVFDMNRDNFVDMTTLYKKTGPFIIRKKNKEGQEFKISKCVWIQLNKEKPGIVHYKTSFDHEDFSEISFMRQTRLILPDSLPILRSNEKAISTAKYKDLMTLLEWVPEEFHDYYKSLIHSADASDVPEAV